MPDDKAKAAEARLKAAQERALRRKLGPPLDWSEQDLETLAVVTAADVKAAEAHARRHGSPLLRGLLGAEPEEEKS